MELEQQKMMQRFGEYLRLLVNEIDHSYYSMVL